LLSSGGVLRGIVIAIAAKGLVSELAGVIEMSPMRSSAAFRRGEGCDRAHGRRPAASRGWVELLDSAMQCR